MSARRDPSPRTPVVVGVGQLRANRARTVEGAREPLALVAEALRAAERDAAVPGLLASADAVHAVATSSWCYDAWAGSIAAAVGARPRTLVDTRIGGHHPARLLDEAAARIWAGDSDVALVAGGEAQASLGALVRAGVEPPWSRAPGGAAPLDFSSLGSPQMLAAGLSLPVRVYPLYENRLQADLGLTPEEMAAWSARLYADYSRVAAAQPAAWDPEPRTAEQVRATRTVCEPYPLAVNAMPHVDQAAAVVVTSLERARDAGLPDERLVHVWGGAGADDHPDPLLRGGFGGSVALEQALTGCLARSGTAIADVDLVDVYSCFPVVPKLAALHLGLDREAVLSVAGGHASFGGPLNAYSLHALAAVVERLRGTAGTGLVHANGGYLTYQHAVLLGGRPHPDGYVGDPVPQAVVGRDVPPRREAADGTVLTVETATVEHARQGGPVQAFLVGRTDAGERVAVCTPPGDPGAARVLSLSALPPGATTQVGRRVRLSLRDGAALVHPLDGAAGPASA